MAIEVTCPSCGAKLKLPEKFAQRGLVCPKCQHEFRLPPLADPESVRRAAPPLRIVVPQNSPELQPRTPQLLGATSPARGSRINPSEPALPAASEAWDESADLDPESGALPPRQEAGLAVQSRKRRISQKREGKTDWPMYALGIALMCLCAGLQGFLIWNNLAKLTSAVPGSQASLVGQVGNAPPSATDVSSQSSPLDRYLSRKSQRELGLVAFVVCLVMTVFALAGVAAVFAKAGKPRWAAFVPIYNVGLLVQIAGRSLWWLLLLCVPFVNLFVFLMVSIDLAHSFGKRAAFGLGLTFLGFLFYPVLGFGNARYRPYW